MYFLRCVVSRLGMRGAFLLVSDQLWFRPGAVQSNLRSAHQQPFLRPPYCLRCPLMIRGV